MSIALNGSTGYLSHGAKVVSSYPFSMAIWVAASTSAAQQAAILQGASATSRYAMGWFTNFGADKNASYTNVANGSASALKNTTPHLSAGTQQLLIVVFESATVRRVYFGSNSPVSDSTNLVDETTSHNQVLLGVYQSNGGANNYFLNGSLAEAHFYSRALVAADYDAMTSGTLPEAVANWVDGWTLQTYSSGGTYTSIGGTRTLTASGGGVSASGLTHPIARAVPGPTISVHPSNQTVTTPTTASLGVTAAASGGGTLSYQWQRSTNGGGSWSNVSTGTGGTTNSYTTAATSVSGGNANNADQWRCVVTETGGTSAGAANSNAATLTVNAAPTGPTINTQPSNQTVTTPATPTFTVAATTSGGALSYQWQRSTNGGGSWSNVSTGTGGTTNSYTTAATSVSGGNANNADQYRCAVTDSNGTTNTSAATLTVNAAPAGLTSSPLKSNANVLHLSAPFEAFVLNVTTGALVVRKTGLTSHASTGVVTFTDAALTAATQYRVLWRRTDTGAQGVELLTAA